MQSNHRFRERPGWQRDSVVAGMGLTGVPALAKDVASCLQVTGKAKSAGIRTEKNSPYWSAARKRLATHEGAAVDARAVGKVLIVEDEETLRIAVAKLLDKRGFSVIEARDGRTAIELFLPNRAIISAVLLDRTLPDMPGEHVFAELCRIDPASKVILTSAFSREQDLKVAGKLRPWSYIRKPYDIDALVSLLCKALAR
jgi:CheY-like chemotaxis protein